VNIRDYTLIVYSQMVLSDHFFDCHRIRNIKLHRESYEKGIEEYSILDNRVYTKCFTHEGVEVYG
jgi:hypothetical protein